MSLQMLCYARNEVYARHGRIFKANELNEYFHGKRWYKPAYTPENFPESLLNEYEKVNVEFMFAYEKELCPPDGYPVK